MKNIVTFWGVAKYLPVLLVTTSQGWRLILTLTWLTLLTFWYLQMYWMTQSIDNSLKWLVFKSVDKG